MAWPLEAKKSKKVVRISEEVMIAYF